MTKSILFAALLAGVAMPAIAQDNLNSNSNSGAAANSGSVSGAESNGNQQSQANIGGNNAGIGSSTSESNSGAVSGSASESYSGSNSNQDQGQSQGQSANNSQGQSQGQSANLTAGQNATNQQGVSVTNQFNSTNHKRSYVGTNTAVPLAASSSFSSDYCGGTVSGGASAAPIGISIGGAAPTFDKSCQSLRRAEKFGMAAANYQNMQQPEMAMRLMSLMVWSICTADSAGPKADKSTATACAQILDMGGAQPAAGVYGVPPAPPAYVPPAPVTPLETQKPNITPVNPDEYSELPPKTPRGDAGVNTNPLAAATLP